MNEVAGLPPVAVDRVRADDSTRTYLSNRVLGIEMRWQEHPFEWIDELIQSGSVQRTPSPHAAIALDVRRVETVRRRFAELHAPGIDPLALAALERHVLEAPEPESARIRPLRLARIHGLGERAVAEACLHAAGRCVFELLWDVPCPLCQIPSTFEQSLAALETHASCPACELQFPLDFARSVELVFRTAPEVRPRSLVHRRREREGCRPPAPAAGSRRGLRRRGGRTTRGRRQRPGSPDRKGLAGPRAAADGRASSK